MSQYLNISPYSFIYLFMVILFFIYTIKNRLDILSVGMVCYVVYTMYCFFGYGISGHYRPRLSPTLYWLVFIQMAIILFYTNKKRKEDGHKYLKPPVKRKQTDKKAAEENKRVTTAFGLYTAVIVFFALISILPLGFLGLAAGKANVWENTSVLYIICLYGAFPSFVYGICAKKKKIWIPSLLIECTIFFAGSRAFLATLIVIFLCAKGVDLWRKEQNNRSVFILGAVAIGFLLVYRTIDTSIMAGNIGATLRILSRPATWLKALEFNEPRVIIANYDYSITSGIQLPFGDILYRILDLIPGLTSLFSIDVRYPEYFSDWLMVEVEGSAGVGGSIWGESYAMFGFVGVLLFTALFMAWLRFANNHLDYRKPYSSFIVALAAYHAWYINRLDFNRVGQSIKIMFLCFLIWSFFYLMLEGELKIGKRIRIKMCKPLIGIKRILWNRYGKIIVFYAVAIWKRLTAPTRRWLRRFKSRRNVAAMRRFMAFVRRTCRLCLMILNRIWTVISSPFKKLGIQISRKTSPYYNRFMKYAKTKILPSCRKMIRVASPIIDRIVILPIVIVAYIIWKILKAIWSPIGRLLGKAFRILALIFVRLCAKIEAKLLAATSDNK